MCDQDDIWKLNKVEIMANILSHNKNMYSLASSFEFINQNDEKFDIKEQKINQIIILLILSLDLN
ncbi:hypothetical protein SD457_23875 [Coprobacillaceae bacterium CR2/5/TPMF4]|nr:hypothetical protein SD457_23875 [Coprobacillaceae bacterium CR2/5/TPMF4]